MSTSSVSASTYTDTVYLLSDLCPDFPLPMPADALVRVRGYTELSVSIEQFTNHNFFHGMSPASDAPGAVRQAIRKEYWRITDRNADRCPAKLSAEALAARIRDRRPMTATELLADPGFHTLALMAARANKTYTQELLQYERKAVVQEAVAVLAVEVAEERRLAAREEARRRKAYDRQRELEKPARSGVRAAYDSCDYRTAKQGHAVRVVVLPPGTEVAPGATSHMSKGEQYSSRCTFRKQESVHTMTVRRDWMDTVSARSLDTYRDEVVLDAEPAGYLEDGSEVLDLIAVRQERGTGIGTHKVMVVEVDGEYRDLAKGEKVLSRKDLAGSVGLKANTEMAIILDALCDAGRREHGGAVVDAAISVV